VNSCLAHLRNANILIRIAPAGFNRDQRGTEFSGPLMCNRFIAREIDFHRIGAILSSIPSFEEFTEKPRFDASKIPSREASVTPAGGTGVTKGSESTAKGGETKPTDRTRVIRVVDGKVRVDFLKWGLAPSHSAELELPYSTFNARGSRSAHDGTTLELFNRSGTRRVLLLRLGRQRLARGCHTSSSQTKPPLLEKKRHRGNQHSS
jgi:hypothetical protein